MPLRLFTTPLLALLLLGTLSCSKKQDNPAPAPNMGSYTLDGRTVSCKATMDVQPAIIGLAPYETLRIILTTTPQPANGPEVLYVNFQRSPNIQSAFNSFIGCTYEGNGSHVVYSKSDWEIGTTGSGGFSGRFSGQSTSPASIISNGMFTDVHP